MLLDDVTDPDNPRQIAASTGSGDNSEHLWLPLVPGRHYRLQVRTGQEQAAFNGAYALAWRMTHPPDTDDDGLPDDWELFYGLDPLDPTDGDLDSDADGLTNIQEYLHGTDPTVTDTDGDGFSDGIEIALGADPLDPRSTPQTVAVPALGPAGLALVFVALCAAGRLLAKPAKHSGKSRRDKIAQRSALPTCMR